MLDFKNSRTGRDNQKIPCREAIAGGNLGAHSDAAARRRPWRGRPKTCSLVLEHQNTRGFICWLKLEASCRRSGGSGPRERSYPAASDAEQWGRGPTPTLSASRNAVKWRLDRTHGVSYLHAEAATVFNASAEPRDAMRGTQYDARGGRTASGSKRSRSSRVSAS